MIDFLKTWATSIIAIVALVQPWVVAFWRKYVRRASVELYRAGTIEIGFSGFGPTIALQGTLTAIYHDSFIRDIELRLTREKDRAEHTFYWTFIGPPHTFLNSPSEPQMCTAFLLTEQAPLPCKIFYLDRDTLDEMRGITHHLHSEWQQKLREAVDQNPLDPDADLASIGQALQQARAQLYESFCQGRDYTAAFDAVQRLCYWEPGDYSLKVIINAVRPEKVHVEEFRFALLPQEVGSLRLNIITILREACDQSPINYNFGYARYLDL